MRCSLLYHVWQTLNHSRKFSGYNNLKKRTMNMWSCIFLCLFMIVRFVFCKEALREYLRLKTSDVSYGTSLVVEGPVSTLQCVTKCSETNGCVSVNVQRENLQCELSEQDPLDNSITPNQRPGWTVYYIGRRNCKDIMDIGDLTTGFKTIYIDGLNPVSALCEMDIEGGGWTVIQKRESATDFYKDWQNYRDGFGDDTNFWIGLENIHRLTSLGNCELRVDMRRADGSRAAAKYQSFAIGNELEMYSLSVGGYSYDSTFVDPGDSLIPWQNGMKFTTYDRDNDIDSVNCAVAYKGGYWYKACQESNLNGEYGNTALGEGINWYTWTGWYESLIYTRMMIKPK